MNIPDPIQLLESRIEGYMDAYVDENTCMGCSKKVDYELLCPSPIGDGPALCVECLGFDPFEIMANDQ
jgi:hypothetical protein